MALSGNIIGAYGTNDNYLSIRWSTTQNKFLTLPTTTITAELYINNDSLDTSAYSASGTLYIGGETKSYSSSGTIGTPGGPIGGSVLITTLESDPLEHTIDGFLSAITLKTTGSSYPNPTQSVTIDRIDEGIITSSTNFTAGFNLPITILRRESTYSYEVTMSINAVNILDSTRTFASGGTDGSSFSSTITFSIAEITKIFDQLNGAASLVSTSGDSKINLTIRTKDGATTIGTLAYVTITITAPAASTISSGQNFIIGEPINISVSRVDLPGALELTHSVIITAGDFSKTLTGVGLSTSYTPNATEVNEMFSSLAPGSTTLTTTISCQTFYNGERVRSAEQPSESGIATAGNRYIKVYVDGSWNMAQVKKYNSTTAQWEVVQVKKYDGSTWNL